MTYAKKNPILHFDEQLSAKYNLSQQTLNNGADNLHYDEFDYYHSATYSRVQQTSQAECMNNYTSSFSKSPQSVLEPKDWVKFVKNVWSKPDPTTIHHLYLPPHMSIQDPRLKNAEIIEYRRTQYPPGVIPQISLFPAQNYDVSVAEERTTSKIPPRFVVVSEDLHAEYGEKLSSLASEMSYIASQ